MTDLHVPLHHSERAPAVAPGREAAGRLPIASLLPADSPRLDGENEQHIRMLTRSGVSLPPILVNRATCRVVDGMHRVRAAQRKGERAIEVIFFDGDDEASFVAAVRANVTHGMPLSRGDRSAAAARIVRSYPHWSDRRIAEVAGLSPKTVGAVRRRSAGDVATVVRVGRDGKSRALPASSADAVANHRCTELASSSPRTTVDPAAILWSLRRVPALRFTEMGRVVLRILSHSDSIPRAELDILIDAVPAHCVERIADLAHQYSSLWLELARRLDEEAATHLPS